MTGLPAWRGEYVEVTADGQWRFWRCLRCERELSAPNEDGYGPECKRHRPLDWRTERRKALKADRALYRRDASPTRGGDPPTPKQLTYLRSLARREGTEAPAVRSRVEASLAIKRLKGGRS